MYAPQIPGFAEQDEEEGIQLLGEILDAMYQTSKSRPSKRLHPIQFWMTKVSKPCDGLVCTSATAVVSLLPSEQVLR